MGAGSLLTDWTFNRPRDWTKIDPGLPFITPYFAKAGHVADIIMAPCDVDPWMAVYAAFEQTPQLLWSIYKPTAFDLVTERFTGGRLGHKKRKFTYQDRLLGKKSQTGKWGWAVFKGAQFAERVGWYMLIADATMDYLVNWTSMAYQYSGCEVPGLGGARIKGTNESKLQTGPAVYTGYTEHEASEGFIWGFTSVGIAPGYQGTFSGEVTIRPSEGPVPTKQWCRIWFERSDGGWKSPPLEFDKDKHQERFGFAVDKSWGQPTGIVTYHAFIEGAPGQVQVDIELKVVGGKRQGILGDP